MLTFQTTLRRMRTGSPMAVRLAYRILRSFVPAELSRPIPPHLVADCRCVASREFLLDELPSGGNVAEVGTYRGDFARQIMTRCNPRELHLIDIDYSRFNDRLLNNGVTHRHCGWAQEILPQFPREHFDWIYLDADHSYRATLRDARLAADRVKPGGFLVFNDFAHTDHRFGRYGVHRAVVDFAIEQQWPFAFFAFAPDALYDIALRKPQ